MSDPLKVHNGDDQWWWAVPFCSQPCWETLGHGDEHRHGCQQKALHEMQARIDELEAEMGHLEAELDYQKRFVGGSFDDRY